MTSTVTAATSIAIGWCPPGEGGGGGRKEGEGEGVGVGVGVEVSGGLVRVRVRVRVRGGEEGGGVHSSSVGESFPIRIACTMMMVLLLVLPWPPER